MNKTLSTVLAVFLIIALCVVGTGVLGLGLIAAYDYGVRVQSPVVVATDESSSPTIENSPSSPKEPEVPQPAQNTQAETLTINVDGSPVTLTADSNGAFFYATTIDQKAHSLRFTPPTGYSWAMDADDAMGLAKQNALDDVLLFSDVAAKEFNIWGVYAGGLYIAPMGERPDFAGPALRNRAQAGAQYQCPRPVYYMEPDNDTVVNVSGKVNPFTSICGN